MSDIRPVAEIRERFRLQIEALRRRNAGTADRLLGKLSATPSGYDRGEWSGDIDDIEGISAAFDRTENAQDVIAAISDDENPGGVGDLVASALQADYLAAMERAFRSQFTSPLRRRLHAAARLRGQAQEGGLFSRGVVGFIQGVLRHGKDTA